MTPPGVKVKASTGAGHAMMAGMVFAPGEGGSFRDAVALGVACGIAATLHACPLPEGGCARSGKGNSDREMYNFLVLILIL